jgi:hypothetical protein
MKSKRGHKTPSPKKNKKIFQKPIDKSTKVWYNIRAVGQEPTK